MAFKTKLIEYVPKDADGDAATPDSVACTVTPPNEDAVTVSLTLDSGTYTGYYTPTRSGTHEVEIEAAFSGGLVDVEKEKF